MKILFVCRANSGRSQVAMEFYNQLHPNGADSAGTHVEPDGQVLKDRPQSHSAITAMQEVGIDMSENIRRQLKPDVLANYDQVVVLAETKSIPDYLNSYPGAEFWHVEDLRDQSFEESRKIRDEIKSRVSDLSKRLDARSN